MAISIATVRKDPDVRRNIFDITLDASYASGGYAVTAAQMGVLAIDNLNATMTSAQGFYPQWNNSTQKLKLYKNAAGAGALAECVNTDLSTSNIVRVEVQGNPIL